MSYIPDASLSAVLDRVVERRIMGFRDNLSPRTHTLRADEVRRGATGIAGPWKLWSSELEILPQLVEAEALTLLEEAA